MHRIAQRNYYWKRSWRKIVFNENSVIITRYSFSNLLSNILKETIGEIS
jgi:hypothetical protein